MEHWPRNTPYKKTLTHLIGCLSHELLGLLPPDGRNGDDPPHVVTPDVRSGGVAQLHQRVVPEVPQRHGEDRHGGQRLAVGRPDLRVEADFLEKYFF